MMKYLGYATLLLAGVAGAVGVRVFIVPLLALATTFLFSSVRWKTLKGTPQVLDKNRMGDLVFLFASQCLIVFVAYLLGVFVASPGGDQFAGFLGLD